MLRMGLCGLIAALLSVAALADDDAGKEQALARGLLLKEAYRANLFPHHDAFARIFDPEQGKAVLNNLKFEIDGNDVKRRPLADILDVISEFRLDPHSYSQVRIDAFLDAVEAQLASRVRVEKQSNLLGLHYLLNYLQRFVVLPNGNQPTDATDTDAPPNNDQQDQQNQEDQEAQPPEFPELPDTYQPHTKDTEQNKQPGKKSDQVVVIEANFKTAFFGQRYYGDVLRNVPLQGVKHFSPLAQPGKSKDTEQVMKVKLLGKTRVPLLLPPGFRPLQPFDARARIERDERGGYVLSTKVAMDSLEINLEKGVKDPLSPADLQSYKQKVGFALEEWPLAVRQGVFAKFAPLQSHDAVQVARTITHHLNKDYLYSVGARSEKDPVDALVAGAFQCDMAAYTMVALLRDAYDIPSRVVAGFRAKRLQTDGVDKSYLLLPADGHAWVEVYHDGEWVAFDPTPLKKDKKSKDEKDGDKDDYSDQTPDDMPEREPEPEPETENGPTEPAQGDKEGKDGKEGKENKDEKKAEDAQQGQSTNTTKIDDPRDAMDLQELADLLELGSLSLLPDENRSPLRERAQRMLLRQVLDVRKEGAWTLNHLQKMEPHFAGHVDARVREIYQEAKRAHVRAHQPLASWLSEIAALIKFNSVSETYTQLVRATQSLEVFLSVLDDAELRAQGLELLAQLKEIKAEINQLAHPDSESLAVADAFFKTLPEVVQGFVRKKYGLEVIAPDAASLRFMQDLKDAKLQDLSLLVSLVPLTDFILSAQPMPEYEPVKTFLRNPLKVVGRDLLPLLRYSELARALFLQPQKSIEQNLMEGTVVVPTTRKQVFIPTGFGKEDSERITILLFDISGSMGGDPAKFQAGLIAAFTTRAISDVSPSGRIRHKVVLVPFDDKVHDPMPITTREEAIELIGNYQSKLGRAEGGTDIQSALMQAFALIADAQLRQGEPLAAANVVLFTDGYADIDTQQLAKARSAIDERTPVQVLFGAIGGSNPQLEQFSIGTGKDQVGIDRAMYHEFTTHQMRKYLSDAQKPVDMRDKSQMFTLASPKQLSGEISNRLGRATSMARVFAFGLSKLDNFLRPAELLQKLASVRWNSQVTFDRPLEAWLNDVRAFVTASVFRDTSLLAPIAADILGNFETITGIALNDLSHQEQERLRHFLEYVNDRSKSP